MVASIEELVINGRVAQLKKLLLADSAAAQTPGLVASAALNLQAGVLELLLDSGASADDEATADTVNAAVLFCVSFANRSPLQSLNANGDPVFPRLCALDFACLRGDVGLVELLLARGARPRPTNAKLVQWTQAVRQDNPTWQRCAGACLAALEATRRRRARRRLRVAVASVALLQSWHARAAERAYAPGGVGFRDVEADFARRCACGDGGDGGDSGGGDAAAASADERAVEPAVEVG